MKKPQLGDLALLAEGDWEIGKVDEVIQSRNRSSVKVWIKNDNWTKRRKALIIDGEWRLPSRRKSEYPDLIYFESPA